MADYALLPRPEEARSPHRVSLRQEDGRRSDGFLIFGRGARREGIGAQRGGWRCFVRRLGQEAAPVGRRGGLINDGVFAAAESDEVSCHAPSVWGELRIVGVGGPRARGGISQDRMAECFSGTDLNPGDV